MCMNTYVGYLTADATQRIVKDKTVVNFKIAKNRTYRVGDQKKQQVTYFECSDWSGRTLGICPYLTKGVLVEVSGEIGARAYLNKAGEAASELTLNVREVILHGS